MAGALNGDGRWGYPVASARPRRKTFTTATSVGFTFVAMCVTIIFFSGHRSMQRMQGVLQSPLMEHPPPGWALMHKTTTVQSATVTISTGETAITGSALTATTTTTTGAPATAALAGAAPEQAAAAAAAAGAAAAAVGAAGVAAALPAVGSSSSSGVRGGFGHMLGDLQHSLHALLTANAGWRPGQRVTRAQLAAAAAASMQDEGRDIELQPHKVAAVLDRAKAQQELQALAAQQGLATGAAGTAAGIAAAGAGVTQELSAEAYAGLYGPGAGTVVFSPHADLDSCPEGSATPNGAAAAVVLLAGSSAAALKRSADSLLLLYGQAAPDIRAAFHLFIGLDSDDAELRSLAHTYALDSLGALKLVHHSSSSEHVSSNKKYDEQQQAKAAAAAGTAAAAGAAAGGEQPGIATQRHLLIEPAAAHTTTATQQQPQQVQPQQQETTQQAAQQQQQQAAPHPHHGRPASRPPSRVRAQHLRLMLHVFLNCFGYPGVLLLEDDLALAPDLLEFFAASHWLLGSDSGSLYCLSAWNPLGLGQAAARPGRLLRADTMPGRAWLITREVGRQLLASWPNSTDSNSAASFDWQAHVNSEKVRQGRQCVVPELPRVVPAAVADEAGAAGRAQGAAADATPAASGPAAATAATGQTTAAATAAAGGGTAAGAAAAGKPAAGSLDQGSVDLDAYLDEEEPDTSLDEQEDGDDQDQQQQQQRVAADRQAHPQAAAVAAGAAGRRRAWLQRDLSLMLEENYKPYTHQLLLAAAPCDVVTAATTTDRAGACVVTYSSGQYLSATAERLGIPLEVTHGQQYCVILPTPPGATQALLVCEKFMPQMAYHGIVAGYNRHGVRVFMVHEMYMKTLRAATEYALQQLQQQQAQQ